MRKRFNTTGVCVPKKHYMVDISNKAKEIEKLIDSEFYFTMNRPRQYGKTTTLSMLKRVLKEKYLVINISFEGIGDKIFECEESFSKAFVEMLSESIELSYEVESKILLDLSKDVKDIKDLSKAITKFIKASSKEVVLFIDEVDKSSNNQLFLSFIGMLRNKYLARELEEDYTFKSVILAGVHDVKSLKIKLRKGEESKYNSPWNIAVDFNVDMSFSIDEISTMLTQYQEEKTISMDINGISEEIYFFTNGYPYLVSRICQLIDEKIYENKSMIWNRDDVKKAIKLLNEDTNTLFESIVKNLENNIELYELSKRILIDGEQFVYNPLDPLISTGLTYGILKKGENGLEISNKIFEEVIYNYMLSKIKTSTGKMSLYNFKDEDFIEHHARLLLLAFLKPIINGVGFDFKEVQVSEEKRLDIVIVYNNFKYIIEMKIWRGQKYHENGIEQLCNYLDIHSLNEGYFVVFNFNKNKEFKEERISVKNKNIFGVYV